MNRIADRTRPVTGKIVGVAIVVAASFAILFLNVVRHPTYTTDGFVYARVMMTDAGYPSSAAVRAAETYYRTTSIGRDPRYRQYFYLTPAAAVKGSEVIANRVLYPLTASFLYPRFGFRSLLIVSAIAFVASGLALFAFLSLFSSSYVAAAATVLVLLTWPVRFVAGSDLTDMSSFFWWVLVLFGLAQYLSSKDRRMLVVIALVSIALSLTRPVPYFPFLAALFCLLVPSERRTGLALTAATAVGLLSYAILSYSVHSGSLFTQLAWIREHEPYGGHFKSFTTWYVYAVLESAYSEVRHSIYAVVPALAAIAAVIGMYLERERPQVALLVGAMFGCALAILFNPVPSALPRVFELPLLPIIAAGALLVVPHGASLFPRAASHAEKFSATQ